MSATGGMITGTDFASIPTKDLERAMLFYGETLGLKRSLYFEGKPFAEFETGNLTLDVIVPEEMGLPYATNPNHLALHVDDVASARAELESRGVTFDGDTFDTGVCHMAFFRDPDGNALMLHHRYAPHQTTD